ncbi:MAG: dTMP kinase [Desulfobacterales bacterium]|nr:dTMP kinase [Desulfobacterales bacterium]
MLERKISLFITFEGIDGCGKTTQISRFAATLRKTGIPILVTREPGGTEIGQAIRDILLDVDNTNIAPLAELFLYAADRAQHVAEVIKPALAANKWVISDRYFDATIVYQGVVLEHYDGLIEVLNREATLDCQPDITFLLDCPAEVGLERIAKRDQQEKKRDRFERKTLDFHIKIRYGYLALANKHKDRFRIIDGTLAEQRVAKKIREIIDPYLPKD